MEWVGSEVTEMYSVKIIQINPIMFNVILI